MNNELWTKRPMDKTPIRQKKRLESNVVNKVLVSPCSVLKNHLWQKQLLLMVVTLFWLAGSDVTWSSHRHIVSLCINYWWALVMRWNIKAGIGWLSHLWWNQMEIDFDNDVHVRWKYNRDPYLAYKRIHKRMSMEQPSVHGTNGDRLRQRCSCALDVQSWSKSCIHAYGTDHPVLKRPWDQIRFTTENHC